jgi:uncharacterized protein YggE
MTLRVYPSVTYQPEGKSTMIILPQQEEHRVQTKRPIHRRVRDKIRPRPATEKPVLPKQRLVKRLRGTARRLRRPSAMTFTVKISATDRRREKAHDAHQRGLVAVLKVLEEQKIGVLSSTMSNTTESTASRKVRPNSPRSPEVIEHTITTTIMLTVTTAGVVLEVASLRGDSSIGISDMTFQTSREVDTTALITEALADSRNKADAIARGLGCAVAGFEEFELQETQQLSKLQHTELAFRMPKWSDLRPRLDYMSQAVFSKTSDTRRAKTEDINWEDLGFSFDLPANEEEYWVVVDWIFEI